MGVFQNNLMGAAAAAASTGGGDFYSYQIANSARFDGSASYLNKTWGSAPSSTTQVALSVWLKKTFTGDVNPVSIFTAVGNTGSFYFNNDDAIADNLAYYMGGGGVNGYTTNIKYRDPSAWFHFVAIINSAASNDYDRLKIYINGELIALNGGEWTQNAGYPNTSTPDAGKNGVANYIGRYGSASRYWSGYMADFIQIDGAAAISDFGETKNGVWIPKDPSGLTFGNNGFHLNFASSGDMGNDVSGNNNDWTANSISAHDQMLDSPTFNSDSNGGNFATMNPLSNGSNPVLGEGNLMMDSFSGSDISGSLANFALPASSGKWYFECFINAPNSGDNYPFIGLTATQYSQSAAGGVDQRDLSINLGTGGSEKNETYVGSITTVFTGVSAYADNTVCGVFVDMDARKLWYAKDGAFFNSGNPQTGANPQYAWTNNVPLLPHFISFSGYGADSVFNFGQEGTFAGNITAGGNADVTGYGNFKYDPGDYKALCAGNLPVADAIDPAQTDDAYPSKVFSAITYTGTGSEKAVAVGWQPDLTWVKERSGTNDNKLTDSVRGATKALESNTDAAETTDAQGVKAFTSTGFTLGTDAVYNNNTDTYISWNWKEGADYGLDIVAYSGSLTGTGVVNISHSLGAIPECIWHMSRSALGGAIRHQSFTSANYMMTNAGSSGGGTGWGNSAQIDKSGNGNMTALGTSSTFTTNYTGILNQNGDDAVAYVWRGIEGFSKFGKYTGNANADGTFVYTGFSPAYVIIKRRDGAESYFAMDNKRVGYNVVERVMQLNGGNPESTTDYDALDFLSNGFKLRLSDAGFNGSEQYIYMAWAENPFKYATAR